MCSYSELSIFYQRTIYTVSDKNKRLTNDFIALCII